MKKGKVKKVVTKKGLVKVNFKGVMVDGVEVEFKAKREGWNEYSLADGSKIRFKSIVTKIVRTEVYNENFEPVYVLSSQSIASTDVPDKLKKLPK